jgi:hypothetical protein
LQRIRWCILTFSFQRLTLFKPLLLSTYESCMEIECRDQRLLVEICIRKDCFEQDCLCHSLCRVNYAIIYWLPDERSWPLLVGIIRLYPFKIVGIIRLYNRCPVYPSDPQESHLSLKQQWNQPIVSP